MVGGESPDVPFDSEVIELWGRKTQVILGGVALAGFAVIAVSLFKDNPELIAGMSGMFYLVAMVILVVYIIFARAVLSEPMAYYLSDQNILTTINMYGVERRWPRYRGEGSLVAKRGRILFLDHRGRKHVVLNRFEVDAAQFDLVYRAIAANGPGRVPRR